MKAGDKVRKVGGSFEATGTIVAAFKNIEGQDRYVMEFDNPKGMLHIYTATQLRVEQSAPVNQYTQAYINMQLVRDVIPPQRAHQYDAGIDFFVPRDFAGVRLVPGQSVLIPSGVLIDVPPGWMMLMENKSGVASRMHLDRLACVIDHGYQGEVHFNLVNNGVRDVIIEKDMKIIQGILVPVGTHEVMLLSDLFPEVSTRGVGGFGSTGQ